MVRKPMQLSKKTFQSRNLKDLNIQALNRRRDHNNQDVIDSNDFTPWDDMPRALVEQT